MRSKERRKRRKLRVRQKVSGTSQRPRLSVFRSLKHIYAQLIDDEAQQTLASASSLEKSLRESTKNKMEAASLVGSLIAKRALAKGIKRVVFDRGHYRYHGRIKALAEAARGKELEF